MAKNQLISLEKLLTDTSFIKNIPSLILDIELLHHNYLQLKLQPNEQVSQLDINLLEDSAYYLSAMATNSVRIEELKDDQLVTDALGVAAIIFEYLGDLVQTSNKYAFLESSEVYYLDAAICNSLSIYEANSMALARKRLLVDGNIDDTLKEFETKNPDCKQVLILCKKIVYTWLGRDFHRLWLYENKLKGILGLSEKELEEGWSKKNIGSSIFCEISLWLKIATATLEHSLFFQSGNDQIIKLANKTFEEAKELAEKQNNPAYYWTINALWKCANKMFNNSIWNCLKDKIPITYIGNLVSSSKPVYELWASQLKVLKSESEKGIIDGYLDEQIRRVLINMPTSAGKSLLAEIAILKTIFPQPDQNSEATCVYVVPSIALVNEVEQRLNERLLPLGIRVTAALGGYDTSLLEKQLFAQTRIAVLTPEKLSLLVKQAEPFIQKCGLFIFDEVHKIDSLTRGWTFEETITWLKDFHPQAKKAKMIFMSAVMANHLQLTSWLAQDSLDNSITSILSINEDWQPTRQLKAICYFNSAPYNMNKTISKKGREKYTQSFWGNLSYIRAKQDINSPRQIEKIIESKQTFQESISKKGIKTFPKNYEESYNDVDHAVLLTTKFIEAELTPVLVFFMEREDTSKFCEKLYKYNINPPQLSTSALVQLDEICSYISDRLGNDFPLIKYLRKGIAFHHGRLPRDVRAEIEYAFSKGWLQAIASTTTLSDGVNFPIRTFILANHKVRTGKDTFRYLEKKDFRNMIGRAGRAVFDTEGQIIFMLPLDLNPYNRDYLDYLFPNEQDQQQWVLSSFARNDFQKVVFEKLMEAFDSSQPPSEILDINPDIWKTSLGYDGEQAAYMALRLQAFVLTMMDNKILDTDHLETFSFFNKTLLSQQKEIAKNIQDLIVLLCSKTAKTILNDEPDSKRRGIYSKTGLAYKSSKILFEFARNFWVTKGQHIYNVQANHLNSEFLLELGRLIFDLRESKPISIPKTQIPHEFVFVDWIHNQDNISKIREKYFYEFTDPFSISEICTNYIYDTFEFKAPWILSAFTLFVKYAAEQDGILDFEITELGFQLSMLPAYAKFGVNSPAAAFFSSIGIRSKEMAKLLSDVYSNENSQQERSFHIMLKWLTSLEYEEVKAWYQEFLGEDTAGQVRRLFRIIKTLQPSIHYLKNIFPIQLYIAGWYYYLSQNDLVFLKINETLILELDPENIYDENAVKILTKNKKKLGYIPVNYSAMIAQILRSKESLICWIIEVNDYPIPKKQRLKIQISLKQKL